MSEGRDRQRSRPRHVEGVVPLPPSLDWLRGHEGGPMAGHVALVVPVRRDDQALVLKLSFPDDGTALEAEALRPWNGDGAVRLIDHDPDRYALLLEAASRAHRWPR